MKIKITSHIKLFSALFCAVLTISCQRECGPILVSNAVVRFITEDNNGTLAKSIDSLYVFPVGLEDSVLYSWARNINSIRLPLSPISDSTAFVMKFNDITEIVKFYYKRQLYFISEECGFSVNYLIDSVKYTNSKIVSVVIINPKVQATHEEHIRFYF